MTYLLCGKLAYILKSPKKKYKKIKKKEKKTKKGRKKKWGGAGGILNPIEGLEACQNHEDESTLERN